MTFLYLSCYFKFCENNVCQICKIVAYVILSRSMFLFTFLAVTSIMFFILKASNISFAIHENFLLETGHNWATRRHFHKKVSLVAILNKHFCTQQRFFFSPTINRIKYIRDLSSMKPQLNFFLIF